MRAKTRFRGAILQCRCISPSEMSKRHQMRPFFGCLVLVCLITRVRVAFFSLIYLSGSRRTQNNEGLPRVCHGGVIMESPKLSVSSVQIRVGARGARRGIFIGGRFEFLFVSHIC